MRGVQQHCLFSLLFVHLIGIGSDVMYTLAVFLYVSKGGGGGGGTGNTPPHINFSLIKKKIKENIM